MIAQSERAGINMITLGNTFKEDLDIFLSKYALWICVAIAVIIAAVVIIILIRNKKSYKGKNDNLQVSTNEWLEALGGKDNIIELSAVGSRLNVMLNNKDLMNREKLTGLGVSNIMIMANKVILVIEDKAEKIASKIESDLK